MCWNKLQACFGNDSWLRNQLGLDYYDYTQHDWAEANRVILIVYNLAELGKLWVIRVWTSWGNACHLSNKHSPSQVEKMQFAKNISNWTKITFSCNTFVRELWVKNNRNKWVVLKEPVSIKTFQRQWISNDSQISLKFRD